MSRLHALLIRPDDDPEVVSDPHWGYAGVSSHLGPQSKGFGLTWQTRQGSWLLLLAGMHATEPNPAAVALAGRDGAAYCGPLLVISMSERLQAVESLTRLDLLLIATHLVVGEVRTAVEGRRARPGLLPGRAL